MPIRRTDELGPNAQDTLGRALANHLLPTPVAGDGTKASSNPATSHKRIIDGRQAYLTDIVQTELLQLGDEHWIESGSLIGSEVLDLLGTPCANPTVRTKFRSRNPNPAELVELLNESKTPLLKTPVASEKGHLDRPERYRNRNETGGRFDLSDQVASLLPTPRAQNGESRNQNIYARPLDQPQNLENALALLPTPTVMDMGSNYTPEEWEAWKLKMKEAHRNGNGHVSSLTQEAITLMGTPTASPGVRTARFRRPGENPMEFVERLNREALTGESTAEPSEDGSEYLGEPLQIQLFLE